VGAPATFQMLMYIVLKILYMEILLGLHWRHHYMVKFLRKSFEAS
jgi:hypothetical protein